MERYLIALGSNIRHHRHGRPDRVLAAALEAMEEAGLRIVSKAPPISSAPIGPSRRRFANGAAVVETDLPPDALLDLLKTMEQRFGRRRGARWAARVVDLDIILWSGGAWSTPDLTIPHPAFRQRPFVTAPASAIAPAWRDPLSGLTLRHLHTRLTRPRPAPTGATCTASGEGP